MPLWKDIEAKAAKLGVTVEQGLLPWLKFGDQHADKLVSQRFACSLGVPLIYGIGKKLDNRSIDTRMSSLDLFGPGRAAVFVTAAPGKMDMSSMEGCCKFIEKLNGELYGFIHSAGVLQDSMLMNLTWEKFETVFQSL